MESIGTTWPGATDSACAATSSRAGTRCTMALTVVSTISGLSLPVQARQPRQRGQALRQDAAMRRDAVIGLAVPGRELHHRQIGREEFQRARQLLHARPVAADHGKADRRRLRPRRDGAREIGDDQALGALGDIGKGQRAAGRKQLGGRFHRRFHASSSAARNALMRANSAPRIPAAAAVAGQGGIEIGIGHFDQALELGQFGVGQVGDLGVGEAAEDQIHLAGAAMPAAKQQPLAAVVEPVARSCRSRHFRKSNPTPKARTCRAGLI